jgi:Anti-sigma-K factor rskA
VSGPASGHGLFEELAAGYALDALEPDDEQLFLAHARGCPQCGPALAAYREVAVALADTAPPAEPSAQLGERILAMARAETDPARRGAASAEPPGQQGQQGQQQVQHAKLPPGVHRLRPRHRWLRPASIAAAVVLIAGGGIWGGLEATSSSPQPPAAFCAHGCSEIVLTAKGTHQVAGKVFVRQQSVWMDPTDMKPDDTADQIYVLWQITGAKAPLAVGSFDVKAGVSTPVEVGSLAAAYHGTVAFAVSLEHGRSIPASPSLVTAIGQVS